jgi:hypothetical protein
MVVRDLRAALSDGVLAPRSQPPSAQAPRDHDGVTAAAQAAAAATAAALARAAVSELRALTEPDGTSLDTVFSRSLLQWALGPHVTGSLAAQLAAGSVVSAVLSDTGARVDPAEAAWQCESDLSDGAALAQRVLQLYESGEVFFSLQTLLDSSLLFDGTLPHEAERTAARLLSLAATTIIATPNPTPRYGV